MAGPSVKQFLELLRQGRILDSEQLDVVTREILPKMADPRGLARELVKRGYLTAFQVNQVSQGRVKDLLVGQYLIMERLGEGGMGQVYKARHQAMGRVVALKVMRPERLANQDSINRFRREIRAAAQLSHPNVVLAYDADEVNGQHYFAMEFVEGIDLSRLVKARGPLPIKAACEYILQAAQGLKHAHERGLVHRDIKPANLLVTPLPHKGNEPVTVKILDMGLARVGEISDDSAYTQLTQDGKVVGTPDYIAPEQARDSRKADIRSDLYSLGCTLYYLLTAKVPFPGGGSVMEKLMKHQMEEPVPIETIRPEVPESLRAILKKLITKRQEDRYQTPSQLVAALEPLVTGNLLPAHAITEALPAAVPVAPAPLAMPITPDMQAGTTPLPAAIPLNQEAPTGKSALAVAGNVAWTLTRHTANALAWFTVLMVKPGPEKSRRVMRNIFAGAIGFVLVCWGIAAMFSGGDKNGNSPVDPNSPSAWLNQLDASNIPADQRLYEQPKELVAVLGDGRGQNWILPNWSMQIGLSNMSYSPDGRLIATTSGGEAHLWDAATLRQVAVLRGDMGYINGSAFISNNQFAAVNNGGLVCIWETSPGKEGNLRSRYRVARTVPALVAGSTIAAGVVQDQAMHTRGIVTWNLLKGSPGGNDVVQIPGGGRNHMITVAPGGKHLAIRFDTGNGFRTDFSIMLWDIAAKKDLATLAGVRQAQPYQFSPDGKLLAVAGLQGVVLADTKDGQQRSVNGTGFVMGMSFGADSEKLFASGGGRIHVIDVSKGSLGSSVNVSEGVRNIEVAPDGRTLLAQSIGFPPSLKAWDVASGRELATLPIQARGLQALMAFAPDSQAVALSGTDNSIRLWNPRSGKEIMARQTQGPISLLALLDDGKTLAVGATQVDEQNRRRAIRFYNLPNLEPAKTFEEDASPNGNWVYVPSRKEFAGESAALEGGMVRQFIKFWNSESFKEVNSLSLGKGNNYGNAPLAVSPDGKHVAIARAQFGAGGGGVQLVLLEVSTGNEAASFSLPPAARPNAIYFSPDGKRVGASGFDRTLHLFDLETKQAISVAQSEYRTVDLACFTFGPNGLAASATSPRGSSLSRVAVWDPATGNIKQVLRGTVESQGEKLTQGVLASLAFSSDGKRIAGSTHDGKLFIWDVATGEIDKEWTIPGPAAQLLFTPNDDGLITGNANGTVFIFRLQ